MAVKEPEGAPEVEAETAGEEDESTGGRASAVVLSALGAVAAWRTIVAFPELAYVVVGSIGTVGVQKARARWGKTGDDEDQEQQQEAAPDVVGALHRLVGDDKGVLLTALRDDLQLPDTKTVKQLLEAEGIPWKPSRTRKGNGPAVRKESIPAASSSLPGHSHGSGCCCRSGDNDNSNNGDWEGSGEGFRVERTDTGFTIHDLSHRIGTGQKGAEDDVIARFLAEVSRAQAKPPAPPTP
ncbi:hypothetical protein K4B79_18745 [Streptomyces lincolnensis]|uniref:hypothetical protein n=1 Tax=Streptomyces lincolnensis TaxID=1915 RepID=UPI001E5796AA|nr:hypothetical protein [Streptomyces lincolnensis]MCD7440254.1 hypothetical protein [Streptomyces lincolnensis]